MPNKMKLKRSLTFGFSIAPLSGALGYAMVALFYYVNATSKVEFSFGEWLMTCFFFFVPVSYVVSLAAGIPLIFFLKRFNRLSFWWVTLPAIALGAIILLGFLRIVLALGGTIEGSAWFEIFRFSVIGGTLGFVVAALFCLLVGITVPSSRRAKQRRAA